MILQQRLLLNGLWVREGVSKQFAYEVQEGGDFNQASIKGHTSVFSIRSAKYVLYCTVLYCTYSTVQYSIVTTYGGSLLLPGMDRKATTTRAARESPSSYSIPSETTDFTATYREHDSPLRQ